MKATEDYFKQIHLALCESINALRQPTFGVMGDEELIYRKVELKEKLWFKGTLESIWRNVYSYLPEIEVPETCPKCNNLTLYCASGGGTRCRTPGCGHWDCL